MSRIGPDLGRSISSSMIRLACCPAGRVPAAAEPLVLVRGEVPAGEPEPAPPLQVHRVGLAGPVERPRHRRPPVDHHRVPVRVVDVPPADVEAVAGSPAGRRIQPFARFGLLSLFTPYAAGGVVEPAEEERGVGDIAQNLRPAVEVCLEVLLGDGVAAHRAEREDVLPHEPQVLAGLAEVVAFGGENGVRGPACSRAAGRAWRALRLSRWARACVITSMGSGAGTRAEKLTRAHAKRSPGFIRPPPAKPPAPSRCRGP